MPGKLEVKVTKAAAISSLQIADPSQVEELAKSITGHESDISVAELCLVFGAVKLKEGLHGEAYKHFWKAARISEKSKRHRSVLRRALSAMCECLYSPGKYKQAIPIGRRALDLFEDSIAEADQVRFVRLCEWLGYMLLKSGRLGDALHVYERLLRSQCKQNLLFEAASRARFYIGEMVPPSDSSFETVDNAFVKLLKSKFSVSPQVVAPADPALYHSVNGKEIQDPYLWMEELSSSAVKDWAEAESQYAEAFLDSIEQLPAILRRYRLNFPSGSCSFPWRYKDRYLYRFVKPGTYNQLWCSAKRFMSMPKVILDEASLGPGKHVTRGFFSRDGQWLAYGVSVGGSDWTTWYVRNTKTLEELPNTVSGIGNDYIAWSTDGSGFYYHREKRTADEALEEGVYFHKLKKSQKHDTLVIPDSDGVSASVVCADDEIFVYRWTVKGCQVSVKRGDSETPLIETGRTAPLLVANGKNSYWFVAHHKGAQQLLRIYKRSGRKKVVIPSERHPLQSVFRVGDGWVAKFLVDGCSELRLFNREGKFVRTLKVPAFCSIGESGSVSADEFLFSARGYSFPASLRRFNITTGKETIEYESQVASRSEDFTTAKHTVRSKDGTPIVLSLSHKKGLRLTKDTPVMLTAYGGFAVSKIADYEPDSVTWMDMGGVVATAIIRGGGEYGRLWHESAIGTKRQRAFDDFIACAEYLIRKNFTSPKKLAIQGGSNGGLLVATVMTQRPELFGAVNICAPLTDMLRYDKLARGRNWVGEYGSPSDSTCFDALRAYSPYHNVRDGVEYPPTLIQVWQNDDRVCPSHAFKFAARLRAAGGSKSGSAILMTVYQNAGHNGASEGCSQPVHMLSFFAQTFGMKMK